MLNPVERGAGNVVACAGKRQVSSCDPCPDLEANHRVSNGSPAWRQHSGLATETVRSGVPTGLPTAPETREKDYLWQARQAFA